MEQEKRNKEERQITAYFYHTENIQYMYEGWSKGSFPGHLLYGATHLSDHGIGIVQHKFREFGERRFPMMLYVAFQVLFCPKCFDLIYATHYKGLEIIILLRALHLYRKPIVIWHHQPIITPKKKWREWLGRLFYRGIDEMFFFSQKLVDDSMKSRKAKPGHMHVGHWGPDNAFYDKVISQCCDVAHKGFISTGRERRDMRTLVAAFNAADEPLDIYLNKRNCGIDYEQMFREMEVKDNIKVHFTSGYKQDELSVLVYRSLCVCICCLETKYTVGLTTIVEALALGIPMICSRNPQVPIDIEREGCGIFVDYYDTKGWEKAIRYISDHPVEAAEMGRKAKNLALTKFNDEICAAEVAEIIKGLKRTKK